ncbi:hypothetical protein GGR51DRAFT_214273 [Nemania sp. FL0031]|nr:hypothetical protein GGR51DRAFT_214273 [Nemania sp. FL0031]
MQRILYTARRVYTSSLFHSINPPAKTTFLTSALPHAPISRQTPRIDNISPNKRTATTMTTVTLKSPEINVSLPEGLSEEKLLSFPAFNNWLKTLTKSLSLQRSNAQHPFHKDPYVLQSINVQSYDLWGNRVGFLKLQAEVKNAAGESLPGAVFLRGPAVGMLVILVPDDAPTAGNRTNAGLYDEERYVLLTVQPRIPAGSLAFAELPAGMVDDHENQSGGKFAGTAAREIKEELGIEIPASELICLSDLAAADGENEEEGLPSAMFPSAGGCDEYIPIYMHERRVPRDTLKEWTGKLTGLRDEGEKITLKLVPMRDLWREGRRDAKALAALALWEGLRREGKLQGKS